MQVRVARVMVALGVAAELAVFAVYLHKRNLPETHLRLQQYACLAFVVAALGLARAGFTPRRVAGLVLLVGAALQLIALTRAPQTSDDDYRYVWDGKVQLAGIDPYRYTPADPQLSQLRSAPLFGADGPCSWTFPGGCTAINRPSVHTVYPPVAEAAFVVVRLVSLGGHGLQLPFQIVAALGAMAISILLVRRALRRGDPVWLASIWAWCPVVVSEFGNNAHLDWLAVLLSVLGLGAYQADRLGRAGVLIGAAIATKLYPAVLLASLLRRRPWLMLGTSLGFVALTYVPHVAAVGGRVIGYLPGYLHEEGYSSGDHLLLLGGLFPHPFDSVIGVALLATAGVWAWRRSDPLAPQDTAVVVLGVSMLVATPRYGWYAPLLIALIVMSRRIEWLPVALAPSFVYLATGTPTPQAIYGIAAVLTAVGVAVRYVLGRPSSGNVQSLASAPAVVAA